LEFLKLRNCGISNVGFTSIVASRYLKRLKVLILSKNNISKLILPYEDLKDATKLQQRRELMSLEVLDLRDNFITNCKLTSKFFE
jgi:Ran GTPase-activating protein (RanGAP) involved in mRNA processing and transport